MTSHTDIGNAIYTILQGITDFSVVFNEEKEELGQYPACTVEYRETASEFHTTSANRRDLSFNVRIYYRFKDNGGEAIIRDLTDQVITAIESDVTLGGTSDFARVRDITAFKDTREVPVMGSLLTVVATVHQNR